MAKLIIQANAAGQNRARERIDRLKDKAPSELEPHESAVLFLRGVSSRSWIALSHLYILIGARGASIAPKDHSAKVMAHALAFSSTSTITLCCRKVFDHSNKGVTGHRFAVASSDTIQRVADYWSNKSGRPKAEALTALALLQAAFRRLSKSKQVLLTADTALARRVGFLKRHADAQAAHLSMDHYEFDMKDCSHVVAALAVVGALIERFDLPSAQAEDYDMFDQSAFDCAQRIFPDMTGARMFSELHISEVLKIYQSMPPPQAEAHIMERLPYALGWW